MYGLTSVRNVVSFLGVDVLPMKTSLLNNNSVLKVGDIAKNVCCGTAGMFISGHK